VIDTKLASTSRPDEDCGANAREAFVNAPQDGTAADPIAVVLSELQSRLNALPPDL
jgi:hypothetical protein